MPPKSPAKYGDSPPGASRPMMPKTSSSGTLRTKRLTQLDPTEKPVLSERARQKKSR